MNDDRIRIPPQGGTAFPLAKGGKLSIVDPYGEQVCDLFCVDAVNLLDGLSSGRSIDYNDTIHFTNGHMLYSNAGKPLLKILSDTCGTHDFLVTPCSLQMFQMLNPECTYHPSCQENLAKALAQYDIPAHVITTTFNAFMNVPVGLGGAIRVLAPLSKPGDQIVFEAQRDLIVGLTACSDEGSNNGSCKPIEYAVARE